MATPGVPWGLREQLHPQGLGEGDTEAHPTPWKGIFNYKST